MYWRYMHTYVYKRHNNDCIDSPDASNTLTITALNDQCAAANTAQPIDYMELTLCMP